MNNYQRIRFIITALLLVHSSLCFASNSSLLQVQYGDKDIEIIEISHQKEKLIGGLNLNKMACVPSTGFLLDSLFYIFETNRSDAKDYLVQINFIEGTKTSIYRFPAEQFEEKYRAQDIVFINDKKILFQVYAYLNKQFKFHLFIYDRLNNRTERIPISASDGVSSNDGKKIYFINDEGVLAVYEDYKTRSLGIKGYSPSISPNGEYLAFISKGIFFERVEVYHLQNKTTKTAISFFGPNTVNRILRWSPDSKSLALKKQSDFFKTPLHIFDAQTGKRIHEYKRNRAVNWFFTD